MTHPYYDKEGNPIDLMKWADLMQNEDYKIIKQEQVGKYFVSTIWLGLDHNLWSSGAPIIFETMIFNKSNKEVQDPLHLNLARYSTIQEALEGHKEMVDLCTKILEGKLVSQVEESAMDSQQAELDQPQ